MNEDFFDTEKFISLIRAHGVLWEFNLESYSSKTKKQLAWLEVCKALYENFDHLDQQAKNKIGNHLQKRWKNLRNCYSRELRKSKEPDCGDASKARKKYIYFENLSFLQQNYKQRPGISNIDEEEMDLDAGYPEASVLEEEARHNRKLEPRHKVPTHADEEEVHANIFSHEENISEEDSRMKRNEQSKTSSDLDKLHDILKDCLKQRPQDSYNRDEMFLLSLLPDLQEIPSDRKLLAKCEIMKVISYYKNNSYSMQDQNLAGPPRSCCTNPSSSSGIGTEPTSNLIIADYIPGRVDNKREPPSPTLSISSTHISNASHI